MNFIKEIQEWEVLTPSGWSDFYGIKKVEKQHYYILYLSNEDFLICSAEHKLKIYEKDFECVENLKVGDYLSANIFIDEIESCDENIDLYDLLEVEKNNEYYTNDVISHNCAHIDKMDEIWTGLSPTISTGGSVILASTPRGTGNFFHKTFVSAQSRESNFNCRFGTYQNPFNPQEVYDDRLMWWVNDKYDEVWFHNETVGANKSPREVAQEFLCNFNASGDTFIWHEDIAKIEQLSREPQQSFPIDRNIWIWDEPNKEGNYLISCDVSRGDAQDYSAFHVLRVDTSPIVQVAEYKGKIKPDLLGTYLVHIAKYYNNATIAPENNSGWSGQTILKIQEANYPFLFYSRQRKSKFKDERALDPYYAQLRNDYLPGYAITSANRLEMLAKMEQYIRLGEIFINSPRLVAEIKTFIVNDHNKPIAQRGYNDDLVMALAGGIWVREQGFLPSHQDSEMTQAMLAGMSLSNTKTCDYKDLNFDGSNIYNRGNVKNYDASKNKMRMANGEEIDLNWLIISG